MATAVRYIHARHIAPMAVPGLIDNGVLAIRNGRIVAVGTKAAINPPQIDESFDGLLTPGLANAHTHLELSDVPRPPRPGTFQDWLLTTMGAIRDADPAVFAARRAAAVRAGIGQCLRFGVTTVGDVSQNVAITRPILRDALIRGISYGECLGLGERRARFDALLAAAVDPAFGSDRVNVGVSPHAPYTVEPADYERALAAAVPVGGFVTTHLAETPDEAAFIDRHRGPFREMYRRLGFDPGPGTPWTQSVVDKARSVGLLRAGALLAHMNYLSDADIDTCGRDAARIVWCPRTHAYFGHPPHPWQRLLQAGAVVCVGTDSCASSGDLNVMDDLRLVRRQSPDVAAEMLWAMATTNAATAMFGPAHSTAGPAGTLAVGGPADFVAWPTRSATPLDEILDTPAMLPAFVCVGGQLVPA